jgi:PAS domain S-box-containing protein
VPDEYPKNMAPGTGRAGDKTMNALGVNGITADPSAEVERLRRECARACEAQLVSEESFRELAESINEVFWMTDSCGERLQYVSPGYERIWGRTCEDLYANPASWIAAVHPADRERVADGLTGGNPQPAEREFRIIRPDGSVRWIRDKAVAGHGGNTKGRRVGLFEDISDQKRMEEQVRQSQKMDAIGTLAGGIAHDFNNILSVISGYTELLRMALPKDSPFAGHVVSIGMASTRAARLVRQILTFSRRDEVQREPVQLPAIVDEALRFLRATLPATLQVTKSYGGVTAAVMADPTQVHQVLLNLGTNAWHAMKETHGRLAFAVEDTQLQAGAALQLGLQPGPYVRISVSDSGRGMDQATLARIFEPYFTTKPLGEGTGLGLAVVHGIMRSHDGAVSARSQPGEGTTFDLYFPALAGAVSAAAAPSPGIVRGHGERILFVDDEESIVAVGQYMLAQLGYSVEATTCPGNALEVLRARPHEFDLVITDLAMPAMTGIELARQISKLCPELPVILTTGFPGPLTLAELRTKGISDLLHKPPTVETLGAAIRKALESRRRV